MKKLACILALSCILSVKAIPYLDVTFSQDNWYFSLDLNPGGFDAPTSVGFYVDGIQSAYGGRMGYDGYLNDVSDGPWSPGVHTPSIRYDDDGVIREVFGGQYTILQPTGDRPQDGPGAPTVYSLASETSPVPDVGPSAILFAISLFAVFAFSWRRNCADSGGSCAD